MVEAFEKTLTGGFSGANTRLAFDTEILSPNYTNKDFNKMNIDESSKPFKREDLKDGFRLKLDGEKYYFHKRVIL